MITIIFFVVFDRILKTLVLRYSASLPISIIDDIFKINYSINYHLAFSLPLESWAIKIATILIIFLLSLYFILLTIKGKYTKAGFLTFVIFGALSNLVDRFKYGYVIDYLDLRYFTIFNLADVMIAGGIAGLIFMNLNNKKYG